MPPLIVGVRRVSNGCANGRISAALAASIPIPSAIPLTKGHHRATGQRQVGREACWRLNEHMAHRWWHLRRCSFLRFGALQSRRTRRWGRNAERRSCDPTWLPYARIWATRSPWQGPRRRRRSSRDSRYVSGEVPGSSPRAGRHRSDEPRKVSRRPQPSPRAKTSPGPRSLNSP